MALQTDGIALINMQYVAAFALKRAKVPLTVNIVMYLKSFCIGVRIFGIKFNIQ